ncbi:MAG: cation:proton antiporter [Deltaproteobacteria bacterium]|jgi:CPA2 family monovalent cation:H+ antiporter-2|nr:cation:proton antiporter [Deltaproteobacteria bacterium]
MEISPEILIGKIIALLGLAVGLIYFGLRLKMPAIVGFLVTGVLVGPHGLGLISDPAQVESLSELGVVLLLFTIGLEFSIQSLLKMKRLVLLGGGLQMAFGTIAFFSIAYVLKFPWNTSLLFGFLFSLSSTAIVLKLLQEKGEMDSAHGRGSFGVLIFQDLAVVPLVLILPIMAGQSGGDPLYLVFGKVAAIGVIVVGMANWVVPWVMKKVAATRSNELFMFAVALICLGTAFLTAEAGLSLALGAFMAGLIIAGSPYAYQAISSVMPMRDIFTSLFFVSIGMKMDIKFLFNNPLLVIGLSLIVMIINVSTTALAMKAAGQRGRVAVMVGFALCQVGEFAFVLAKTGGDLKLLDEGAMIAFLNVAVLTMAMTPLALEVGRRLSPRFGAMEAPFVGNIEGPRENHAVVIGFGVAGQAVARACRLIGRQYAIIDMNPGSVQSYQAQGEPIIFGDAVNEVVLEHVGIHRAAILVVSIPDPVATRRIIAQSRRLNPNLYIVARTRFLLTGELLLRLGANEVLAEEFEAALAVFNSVLSFYKLDHESIVKELAVAREKGPIRFHATVTPRADHVDPTPLVSPATEAKTKDATPIATEAQDRDQLLAKTATSHLAANLSPTFPASAAFEPAPESPAEPASLPSEAE